MAIYPVLQIDTPKIRHNAKVVADMLGRRGIRLVAVAKAALAEPAVAKAMVDGGASALGDSRIENLRRLRDSGYTGETMLLRAPSRSRVAEVVEVADVSLNSDAGTVRMLGEAVLKLGKTHKVILMVDIGDLREGVLPEDALRVAREMAIAKGVELVGIGTNLACYGGVIPTREKMEALLSVKKDVEAALGRPLQRVSGGNSANMPLVMSGEIPDGINELRIGESILLGTESVEKTQIPGCHLDAFTMSLEVIEVVKKPSVPLGKRGIDAFGVIRDFANRGSRTRAILAAGRQDLDPESLVPLDAGIEVIGASSDHLICDVEAARPPVKSGDILSFIVGYGALLRAATSPYVEKIVR